jgi:hypothetical protein
MTRNMGNSDRWLRALAVVPSLAAAAILLGIESTAGIVLLAAAAIMLATASAGFCPLYTLFRITTRRRPPLAQWH